ncbi:laccase domain-containing protein [Draconibacterium orientale]|uniref:laccase domain-containing protein n=1 Tax=Draconibacterium orientale TaxID=1168034 RepID=UPI002ABE6DD1|nr:laccase domain-containing protein [Draconibacterium orientale]
MDRNPNLVRYDIFQPFPTICAFTTTKSTVPVERVRYSNVPENKAKLAEALALEAEQMVYPDQTHSSCVAAIQEVPEAVISETDALVTNQPGLCLCVQTADEVVAAARKSIPNVETTLHKNSTGNFHFNLWEANRQLLLKSGVPAQNIEVLGACSFSEAEKYYSARREGVDTGRMVSGIMIL